MDNRGKLYSSIKYCYLQYLCCLLCNPTTRVNQIKDSDGHSEILRAVKTDSTGDINRSITFSEDLNNMSANTKKKTIILCFLTRN